MPGGNLFFIFLSSLQKAHEWMAIMSRKFKCLLGAFQGQNSLKNDDDDDGNQKDKSLMYYILQLGT